MGVLWGQSARYFRLLERRCYDCVRFFVLRYVFAVGGFFMLLMSMLYSACDL